MAEFQLVSIPELTELQALASAANFPRETYLPLGMEVRASLSGLPRLCATLDTVGSPYVIYFFELSLTKPLVDMAFFVESENFQKWQQHTESDPKFLMGRTTNSLGMDGAAGRKIFVYGGHSAGAASEILASVYKLTDKFIGEYLRVNAEECP